MDYSYLRIIGVGICHLAQAVEGDTHVSLEEVDEWSYCRKWPIVYTAKRASSRREVLHTDFITPPVLKNSVMSIEFCLRLKTIAQGGYREAKHCRLSFGHPEILTTVLDIVGAVSISGNFGFQLCSHRDFLGSILGTGIAREKVGDILLLGEKGAHVYVVPEVADFLTVGNVPVTCKKIPLIALEHESPRIKIFRTEKWVDYIASAGFKMTREQLVGLISDGDVRVNSVTLTMINTTARSGDMITVRGKGRLKIKEVNETKNEIGKFAVELIRYL
ncbi:RNA-binding S4 domain-containing protein [Tanacetum coccineum]|uniref:RNA-binding S4 domain-containing protein n=1 Tax=Tanacetum coccineum TaxID=301880 RepID=A0ABQ4YLS0_9ASTR